MAEYIERDALVHHFMTKQRYLTKDLVMDAAYEISKFTAADVVEVVRGEDSVLAEFEEEYKEFKKIKTHLAQIIVGGKVEKPYYSILWWDEESKEYHIGYSSFCLDYVRKWLSLAFEIVGAADVVAVVRCRDCKFFEYGDYCSEDKMEHSKCRENDFCSYGERRESNG